MSSEMIERLVPVLHDARIKGYGPGSTMLPGGTDCEKDWARRALRDVLQAMRVPVLIPIGCHDALLRVAELSEQECNEISAAVWTAIIDAALKEPEKG